MASSLLPCPLTHRLINGGREEERPGLAIKTKDALVVRGPGRQGKQTHAAVGPCRGWWERDQTSQREGQNDRQEQGHGVRGRAEEGEGSCEDRETGQGEGKKDRQSQED